MATIKLVIGRGWSLILITLTSLILLEMNWSIWLISSVLAVLVVVIVGVQVWLERRKSKQQKLGMLMRQFHEQAEDFRYRFVPSSSSLSIFRLIKDLGSIKSKVNPEFAGWARGCTYLQDALTRWLDSVIGRLRVGDTKITPEIFNEFWHIFRCYYQLVDVFYIRAQRIIAEESALNGLKNEYNKSVDEYNNFVSKFRDYMAELDKNTKLSVQPSQAEFAQKL